MRSINESESRPRKGGISLLEVFMVLGIASVTAAGAASYYGSRSDELLAAGTERLVLTLSQSQMNEACPEQESGVGPNCRTFGEYRVRQTHDDSWTISRVEVERGVESDRELVLVSGGQMYLSGAVGGRQRMSARFEAIKGVVGKSASEIAAEKG